MHYSTSLLAFPGKSVAMAMSVGRSLTCKAFVYKAFGKPRDVVKLDQNFPIPIMGAEDISVNMLMCPINPADINQMQGVYGTIATFPAVGGSEGVGVVTEVGGDVKTFEEGDWVIPATSGLGTWRSILVSNASNFMKISKNVPLHMAATMFVNPPTAYRMLKDFVELKEGDCIIQNGANSAVGQSVIQLAAVWGIKTINIIRERVNKEKLYSYLKELGATEVISESQTRIFGTNLPGYVDTLGRPRLGLNCVGGKSAMSLSSHLVSGATVVSYGGMSLQPILVGAGTLIFKDLRFVGYWNSRWLERNMHSEEHVAMMSELCRLAEEGLLRPPLCMVNPSTLDAVQDALDKAVLPYIGHKQLIRMNPSSSHE